MSVKVGGFAAIFLSASVGFGWAQSPVPGGSTSGRATLTTEQRQEMRNARRDCRAEVKVDASDRRARARAMRECVETKSPTARQINAERQQRRQQMNDMRRDCRDTLKGRTMSSDERRTAMQSCMIAKRPELKKNFDCANQAREKGLGSGRERRDFMRTCRRS